MVACVCRVWGGCSSHKIRCGQRFWLHKSLWGTRNHVIQLSLLPSLTLCQTGEFPSPLCLAAFWKLCAVNECSEEQTVIMNMLWRGNHLVSDSPNIWFFSYSLSLLLELKLLAIKEAANSAAKIPRIISLFKAWTHPLLCTTDWFTLTGKDDAV